MRTMLWHNEGRVCMVVHTEANPANHEWLAYLNAFSAHGARDRRLLVYTRGGSPNGAQRKELEATLRHAAKLPTAIITGSAVVRAVGVIIKFFSPLLHMFSPDDEQKALDYLGLTRAEQQRARENRARLEADLDAAAHAA